MSVSSPSTDAPAAPRAVKNPLSWYMPRFWHGMGFPTWLRELARHRFAVSPSRAPMTCAITAFTLMNSVLAVLERVVYGRRIDATELAEPPLFILGHWRAGTTFLHELLIRDPRHTYPTTYQCFAPSHFVLSERYVTPYTRVFVPERRPMDNMAAGWDRPMEDEFALANLGVPSVYLCFMFPNHRPRDRDTQSLVLEEMSPADQAAWRRCLLGFVKRVALGDPRRIVLKSPTHTARIGTLLTMFPDARFVHICRDPYALYRSTVSLWHSLNAEEGLQAVRDDDWVPRYVLDNHRRMYDAYLRDRALLRSDQLVELRYEDLVADPKGQLRTVYQRLGLGDFAAVEPALDAHLAEVQDYRTNRHSMDDATSQLVRNEWGAYFEAFGYA